MAWKMYENNFFFVNITKEVPIEAIQKHFQKCGMNEFILGMICLLIMLWN